MQQNGKHSTNTTVVQFDLMKDNQSQFVGTAQELSKINPLGTPDINAPDVNIGINSQQQVGIPPIPQPVPVNINVSAPFVNDQAVFANPNRANANIQRAAQAFINNPNATQIRISINTTANPNQAGVVFQNGQNFGQILQQRGNLVRQNLINQGVPPGAFGPNSIQINFNQNAVNTNINIR